MHNAPSVSYPTGRSVLQRPFVIGLVLCVCAVNAAWLQQGAQPVLLGVSCAASALATWLSWRWLRTPGGELVWDGTQWLLRQPEQLACGRLVLCADAQRVLLLRWDALSETGCPPRRCWLWLERGAASARWLALRRAVVQHADTT